MPEWMKRCLAALKGQLPRDFIGQIEINVFRGGVSNVNIKQSFKEEDTTK